LATIVPTAIPSTATTMSSANPIRIHNPRRGRVARVGSAGG
jgi:hypothetical protein